MREGKSTGTWRGVFPVESKMSFMTLEKVDSTIQANTLDFEELSLPPADLPGRVLLSQSHSLN